jgi:hypothetical protein
MRHKLFLSRVLLLIAFSLLSISCGKGEDDSACLNKPNYNQSVQEWTVKGDSMAWNLANLWMAENDGQCGACVEEQVDSPDARELQKVVFFIGYNNITKGDDVKQIAKKYQAVYNSTNATVKYCIAVPPVSAYKDQIRDLNEEIKLICGSGYIETWDLPFSSDDGIHPDDNMNLQIKNRILSIQ